jgi:3-deoxy-D-manno-octulosonic acid kinase
MIDEQFAPTARGGILYDASRFVKPDERFFSREHWHEAGALVDAAGGRGGVWFIDSGSGHWVVRHYRRGGAIASISQDRYVWLGAGRTRSFREWRLLATLIRLGLPVPSPVAARYERGLLTYRADLITERLPASITLAGAISGPGLDERCWKAIGSTIADFHAHGVHHADLNAHNIMLGDERRIYVLDFDRGRIRTRGAWEDAVLARLRRSLDKIAAQGEGVRFGDGDWRVLLDGYRAGLSSARKF